MSSIHLLVLIHGMWGNPGHLAELARIIGETYSTPSPEGIKLELLLAETNREESTYDGIDWGGERVAQEVMDKVESLERDGSSKVVHFSATGYSLGGLVARYVIGVLQQRGFFETVTPINFNTLATPHIGLPQYPSIMSSLFTSLAPKLLSRTGEQFYCVDKWSATGRPLLEVMADPDRIFYQGLARFKHLRIYANAINDQTVPYVTSAIEVDDPFTLREKTGIEIELYEEHAPLLKSHKVPDAPPAPQPKAVILSPTWFRNRKPSRPFLPPALQLRFPLNIVIYALLPIILPMGISLLLINLSMAARSSRARIRLLEKDESNKEKLIHILADIERDVERTVADLIDDPDPNPSHGVFAKKTKPPSEQYILTPVQRKIASSLNKLPLKKELAFIENVRNAHAIIVCRDVKRFEGHKAGEGVVRHWAASFIL